MLSLAEENCCSGAQPVVRVSGNGGGSWKDADGAELPEG